VVRDGEEHEPNLVQRPVVGITLRSPAGGFSEGAHSAPSQLLLKAFKGDGFLKHRA
jgi:hypothetical protein